MRETFIVRRKTPPFLGHWIQSAPHGDPLHSQLCLAGRFGAFAFWFKCHPRRELFLNQAIQELHQFYFIVTRVLSVCFIRLLAFEKSVQILVIKKNLYFMNSENVRK